MAKNVRRCPRREKKCQIEREACEEILVRKPKQQESRGQREGRHSSLWTGLCVEPAAGPDVRSL